jgi:hypothetical protein
LHYVRERVLRIPVQPMPVILSSKHSLVLA